MAAMARGREMRSPARPPSIMTRPAPVKSASGVLPDRATPARHLTGPCSTETARAPDPGHGGRAGPRPAPARASREPAAAACRGRHSRTGTASGNAPEKTEARFT
jgi:hypothetical protein